MGQGRMRLLHEHAGPDYGRGCFRGCLVAAISAWAVCIVPAYAQSMFSAKDFKIQIDARGRVISLYDTVHQREYLAPNQPAPLVAVRTGGQSQEPSSATFLTGPRLVRLNFENSGVSIDVAVLERDTRGI